MVLGLECLGKEFILYFTGNKELVCRGARQKGCKEQGFEAERPVGGCYRNSHKRGWQYPRLLENYPLKSLSCSNLSCRCSFEDIRPMLLPKLGPRQEKEEPMHRVLHDLLVLSFYLFLVYFYNLFLIYLFLYFT